MLVTLYDVLYKLTRPLALATDVQTAHRQFTEGIRLLDNNPVLRSIASGISQFTRPSHPIHVGGVDLPSPIMLAAGVVKGDGFDNEADALAAVEAGRNIIPGWRSMPILVGTAEFGSYTRWPRLGNEGTILWRRTETHSTQNRVGLRNPGVVAAATFLAKHQANLPTTFGINIAVSPGVEDAEQEKAEVIESMRAFTERGVRPSWFTLNLSCPNTEDDPMGNQTEAKARELCRAIIHEISPIPLWVKVSPQLSQEQYRGLMAAFRDVGVKAVIATNTRGEPTPDGTQIAGVGGGELRDDALEAVHTLASNAVDGSHRVDVIGCGGVLDGESFESFRQLGAKAAQFYSALIYRGPLAASVIYKEAREHQRR